MIKKFEKFFGKKKENEIKKVGENIRRIDKEYKDLSISFIASTEQMIANMR